jgi:hypothetical protein
MALHAIESPFVSEGKPMTVGDLFVALKVCSERSIRKLTLMDVIRMSYLNANPHKMEGYAKAFHDYSNVGNWPKFWDRNKQQASGKGIPWMLAVVSNLISNGWDEESAWSLPESQAIWYHTAVSIRNGNDVSLLSDDDEDIIKNFKQFEEEAKSKPRIRKNQKTTA